MWAIKILSGHDAGKIFQLKQGTYTIGRSTHVDLQVKSQSVSKVHAQLLVTEDKLIISDTQSSNGVFVNGVKIKNHVIKSGDKVSLSDIIIDVINLPANISLLPSAQPALSSKDTAAITSSAPSDGLDFSFDGAAALQTEAGNAESPALGQVGESQLTVLEKVDKYVDNVALPAVYKFSDKYDLKYIVASFVGIFVLLVTVLTVLPVVQISRDFIVDESRRRTESLARQLVLENRETIVANNEIGVSVDSVLTEPGVDKAFIISAADGHIIAPLNKRGDYSKIPFLQKARKKGSRFHRIMGSQIGVSLPILSHNPATGEPSAMAYAIVLYNMDKVALDFERALGLIIQILIITIIAGGILYFFLYRVILRPLTVLNTKIDNALKDSSGSSGIELESPTPIIQKLISNINSSLSRMGSANQGDDQINVSDKRSEASELVHMFPVAAFAYAPDTELILAGNDYINGHPLFDDPLIEDKYIEDLSDSSLMESVKDLLEKSNGNPNIRHTNILPTQNGEKFEITIKSIMDGTEASYFIFCFTEIYDDEGYSE